MISIYIYIIMLINVLMFLALIISSYFHKFHPMTLSLMLMFYSLCVVLKLNFEFSNYWYSYILFLLMIGGVMILILYLTSISNNELFSMNLLYYLYFFIKLNLIMYIMWVILEFLLINLNLHEDIFFMNKYFFLDMMINIKEIYVNFYISMYMLLYLFILMVVAVLICLKNVIPLRQMLKYEIFI